MPISLAVKPELNEDFAQQVAEGVRTAIRDALAEMIHRLTLSEDELALIAQYRQVKAEQRKTAHTAVVSALRPDQA